MLTTDGGEERKNLRGVEAMYDWLIEVGTDRGDFIVAVGGGVIGDMAGFVAATFLRGVPVVQVPTTLLAQVDSSIGGKTGVDHRLGKNLIGAFHQPSLVVADTRMLETLPEREYRSGWSEIVKMAMIRDAELFRTLEANAEALIRFEQPVLLGDVIRRSIELKGQVVGADERESGLRIILNYGHTIGHALEAATGYRHLLHGEAVAIGMKGAGFIARGAARSQRRLHGPAGAARTVRPARSRRGSRPTSCSSRYRATRRHGARRSSGCWRTVSEVSQLRGTSLLKSLARPCGEIGCQLKPRRGTVRLPR